MHRRFDREPVQVNTYNNGGGGFVGLLTLAFIVLKLVGVITWSWWWVLSPIWIGFLVWIAILALVLFVAWDRL